MSETFSFGEALARARTGAAITRDGWNGKGMWVSYTSGRYVNYLGFWNSQTRKFATSQPNEEAYVRPYLVMKTAQNDLVMGWTPSTTDMLTADWRECDPS